MVQVCSRSGGGLVLRPSGRLCHFALEPLATTFEAALGVGELMIEIDLSEASLVSAAAVGFFLQAADRCRKAGIGFELRGAEGLTLDTLRLLGAEHLHRQGGVASIVRSA